jgi:hypothetical protein
MEHTKDTVAAEKLKELHTYQQTKLKEIDELFATYRKQLEENPFIQREKSIIDKAYELITGNKYTTPYEDALEKLEDMRLDIRNQTLRYIMHAVELTDQWRRI